MGTWLYSAHLEVHVCDTGQALLSHLLYHPHSQPVAVSIQLVGFHKFALKGGREGGKGGFQDLSVEKH